MVASIDVPQVAKRVYSFCYPYLQNQNQNQNQDRTHVGHMSDTRKRAQPYYTAKPLKSLVAGGGFGLWRTQKLFVPPKAAH